MITPFLFNPKGDAGFKRSLMFIRVDYLHYFSSVLGCHRRCDYDLVHWTERIVLRKRHDPVNQ